MAASATRPFGKSGVDLPRVGFGAMGITSFYSSSGDSAAIEEAGIEAILAYAEAVKPAPAHIDTAFIYIPTRPGGRHNEEVVGDAIRRLGRERVFVATKGSMNEGFKPDSSDSGLRAQLATSLGRLGVDCVGAKRPRRQRGVGAGATSYCVRPSHTTLALVQTSSTSIAATLLRPSRASCRRSRRSQRRARSGLRASLSAPRASSAARTPSSPSRRSRWSTASRSEPSSESSSASRASSASPSSRTRRSAAACSRHVHVLRRPPRGRLAPGLAPLCRRGRQL